MTVDYDTLQAANGTTLSFVNIPLTLLDVNHSKTRMSKVEIVTHPSRLKTLVVGDTSYGSFYDFELTQEDLEKAREELNEIEEKRDNCIQILKEKLEKDKDCRFHPDDHYLLSCLRFRKFDAEKAYKTICKRYSIMIKHPELYRVPEKLEQFCNTSFISWLPYKDEEGRVILTAHFRKWNIQEMPFQEMMQMTTAFWDLTYWNPHCQIHGVVGIFDFNGLSVSHVTSVLSPSIIWTLSNVIQECLPVRIRLVLLINCNSFVLATLNTVKFFMKKKLIDRIKLIGSDLTELHKYVNPAILPKHMGGLLEEDEYRITEHMMDNLSCINHLRSFIAAPHSSMD